MLTITSAAAATISTHFAGKAVATSSPSPKQTADLTFCLWHLTVSPSTIVYCTNKNVLAFFLIVVYYIYISAISAYEVKK